MSTSQSSAPAWKLVYTPVERGGRTNWVRVGTAFPNRDGSWNIKLDALPVNATLHMRDADPKEAEPTETNSPRPVPHVSAAPERVSQAG